MPSSAPLSRRAAWIATAIVVGLLASGASWWWFYKNRPPDMLEVLRINNQDVGLMEHFEFPEAAQTFQKVVQMAPGWTPAKINLAIALLNIADVKNIDRAIQIFEQVLSQEPENPYAHYNLGILLTYRNN